MNKIDSFEALKHLENTGFFIVRNYLKETECQEIIDEITLKINSFSRGDGMDFRHPNFENESSLTKHFLMNKELQNICDSYMQSPLIKKRCQAGLVEHHTNTSISSGGGWHVDKRSKQFKAILYLNTVDDSTGYFCIIPQTSKKLDEFKTVPKFHGDTSMTRFETGELIEKGIFETRVKILGNPGDLILVDTSNIHRGEEIQKGKRYSLTNYYYN